LIYVNQTKRIMQTQPVRMKKGRKTRPFPDLKVPLVQSPSLFSNPYLRSFT